MELAKGALQKKNDITWEFFPRGQTPLPPQYGNAHVTKKFKVYFVFQGLMSIFGFHKNVNILGGIYDWRMWEHRYPPSPGSDMPSALGPGTRVGPELLVGRPFAGF